MKELFSGQGWSVWLRRLGAMTRKELLQLLRDPALLFLILYGFTADVYSAGSGVTLQLQHAAVAVHDLDRSFASRELAGRLLPPQFKQIGAITDMRQGEQLLDSGDALMVLSIPPRFERDLGAGTPTAVQIQIDATNTALGFLAYSYATQIFGEYAVEAGLRGQGLSAGVLDELPRVDNRQRVWFNPNQNDSWFMSISELLNVITAFAILLPAAFMVREKERGTIEQLLVSPLTPFQIMAPKVLAMTLIVHAGFIICLLAILEPVFHLPIKGSLTLFALVTTLYVVNLSGLGLFIATVTRNMAQAAMMGILVLAPMMFLSGIWTPPEAMPAAARAFTYISPLYYYMDASYAILLKGAGLRAIGGSVLGILVLGGAVCGFGLWRFRRQFD